MRFRPRSFSVCCVALLWGAFLCSAVRAQPPARVVLVTTDPTASSTRRLEAELLDLGVEVQIIEPDPDEPIGRATLERLARQAGAFAAVRVVPVAAEVEVWVADRVTGKTVVREILHGNKEQASFDDAIAVGAVELLRASLLEVAATERLQGDVPPPEVVRRMVPQLKEPAAASAPEAAAVPEEPSPRSRRLLPRSKRPSSAPSRPPALSLGLVPMLDLGLGGLPFGIEGQVLARTRIAGAFDGEFAAVVPVSPARLEEAAGVAEVSTRWFAMSAVWAPHLGEVNPLLGVGVAAIRAEAWGDAAEPYVGQRQHVWVVAPVARAGFALPLSSTIRFRVDADAAYALKPVPIRFASKQVASWGRPAVLVGAGLEVALPLATE